MANISPNNIITINRGDSFTFTFPILLGNGLHKTKYELQEKDAVYLGIMEANQPFEFALIKKVFTSEDVNNDGTITITFKPQDTLMVLPGTYYYSIKLSQIENGVEKVTTLIQQTKFIIIE